MTTTEEPKAKSYVFYTSDIVAPSISQALNIINGDKFNAKQWGMGMVLRSGGRLLFKDRDVPEFPLLTTENLVAGVMNAGYVAVRGGSSSETLRAGVRASISHILTTELLNRLDIEDKGLF